MDSHATADDGDAREIFTNKQCRVLDLLIEHKTSKEIARALGISPYTVDQRIALARAKLGVASRNELAARYRAMRPTASGKSAANEDGNAEAAQGSSQPRLSSAGDSENALFDHPTRLDVLPAMGDFEKEKKSCPTTGQADYRVGPEMFEGKFGGWWRLSAIVAIALLLVVTILGLFAIFNQLSEMLS